MQWQPCIKHDKKNSGASAIRNLQHRIALCCVLNAAQGFFTSGGFGRHIWCSVRRTHLCTSRNRMTTDQTAKGHTKPRTSYTIPQITKRCNPYVQTTNTSWIRQVLIFPAWFQAFLPEKICESGLFVKCLQFHLKNRLDNTHRKQISILAVRGREYLLPIPDW